MLLEAENTAHLLLLHFFFFPVVKNQRAMCHFQLFSVLVNLSYTVYPSICNTAFVLVCFYSLK
jgi:hypothetical protein